MLWHENDADNQAYFSSMKEKMWGHNGKLANLKILVFLESAQKRSEFCKAL